MQDNTDLIIRDCCEAEVAEFGQPDIICIAVDVLREIVQRHFPGTCLHQIQEPEADIWPCVNIDVDESGKITNAKLYSPGLPAGNHDVYPVRVPYMDEHTEAWRACVDELEKAVPGFMSLGNMNGIECAVAAIRGLSERAKHQEPSAAEQAARHAGLDEGRAQAGFTVSNAETPQAAPAAVAGPRMHITEKHGTKMPDGRVIGAWTREYTVPAPVAVAVPDGGTPGLWSVRKREVDGELRDCFVTAPDCQGLPYDAEIMGDDEYRDDNGIARKLADCELIVTAVNAYRAALAATNEVKR